MAGNERTVQYEGPLDEPTGAELDRSGLPTSPPGRMARRERRGPGLSTSARALRGFGTVISRVTRRSSLNSPVRISLANSPGHRYQKSPWGCGVTNVPELYPTKIRRVSLV